ncbi:PadR family transcriptional regulator [Clostridium sp. 19966]|uniref:PadR family transcriptional regulator n=1 Tax=Clostridium sp. 19966 TaxID=2768166 RepID=UPI0028DFCE99|nr:PadR family transcriptional regulator [Clostridium sp. 19966]MDT8716935.1 PadR family transcriptional regulator [Clostridium sp. 19966]
MIRALILYFLSVRPTHGYNIQRFIEINGMDKWARIQSGSIYYALNKLEKDGFIYTLKEERNGARIRKIYAINDKGREELVRSLKEELAAPINAVESDKFLIYIMFNRLTKVEIVPIVKEHIKTLEEKKAWWEQGKRIKVLETTLKAESMHFDVVIGNLEYQIKWHEALIEEVEELIKFSDAVEKLIYNIDFDNLDDVQYDMDSKCKAKKIHSLADDIIRDPNSTNEKIEQLIKLLKSK